MPGSSLWLLPPTDHTLSDLLPILIEKTAHHFDSPHRFIPHVTLTSEINPSLYEKDPQAWLNSLDLAGLEHVRVHFQRLNSEDVFVRKLYIQCQKDEILKQLAATCRTNVTGFEDKEATKKWVEEVFNPHLSLLYHDCPKIDEAGLLTVEKLSRQLGILVDSEGALDGFEGGKIVLVPTDKPVAEWQALAERVLEDDR